MSTPSKGIEAVVKLCTQSLFRPTSGDIKQAADELLQEGESGSRALAVLIRELLACRSPKITYALRVGGQVSPTSELLGAIRAVAEASELTEAPVNSRFTPEIIGGGRVGWTSGTYQGVVRTALEAKASLEGRD
jgi:hypothetical protein